jgi:peptidoglycan/LPS O-acetylase OafA/YrhL
MAAAGVLISHAGDLLISHDSLMWEVAWTAGVDIFFVISGFIMAWMSHHSFGQPGAPRRFLIRRAIRIVPPYWFFTTVMIAVVVLLPQLRRNTSLGWEHFLSSYFFIPWPRANGQIVPILSQGWTLNYEVLFYLSFALALLFRRGLLILSIGFVLLAALHPLVPDIALIPKFWSRPIILEFVAGIILAKVYLSGVRLPPWLSAVLFCIGAVLLVVAREGLFGSESLGFGLPWVGVAMALSLSLLFALLFYRWIERPFTNWLQRRLLKKPLKEAERVAP